MFWNKRLKFKKDERGFTLLEIMAVIGLASLVGATVIPKVISSNETSKTMNIESDREMLKTKSSVYYLNNGAHATRVTKLTEVLDEETDNFVRWLCNSLGLTPDIQASYDEIDKRYGWLSSEKLIDDKLLDTPPVDDRYILDTQTYQVYHVTDNQQTKDLLFESGGGNNTTLDNMSVRRFPIETSTVHMAKVNSTVLVGNTIYAGGAGTMQLAKIEVTSQTQKVTDISNKLPDVQEVLGVSTIGSGLRIEYIDTANKVRILKVGL